MIPTPAPRAALRAACFVACALLAPALATQSGLGKASTGVLVRYYEDAEQWALKAIVLLSLGEHWHPTGSRIVLDALQQKDKRLHVYAIESLLRTRKDVTTAVATAPLVEHLVKKGAKHKNEKMRAAVFEILSRVAPDVEAEKPSDWVRWWGTARKTYAPTTWPEIPASTHQDDGKTSTAPFVEKAFDLQAAGLDVVIAIDSTGSMQMPIDAARDALDNIVAILSGIAPKFRLGLVHYRDFGDMSDGAKMLEPLTKNVKKVKSRLGKLVAGGGGDIPERVEKGLEAAFDRSMKWKQTANKVVVLIGDAPPHPDAVDTAVDLARKAHQAPASIGRSGPTTGTKNTVPPFITSAISVGDGAADPFQQIATAGGGAFARIGNGMPGGHGRRGGGRPGRGRGERVDPAGSSKTIAGHILSMSFGERWRQRMDEFVSIYFEYRDAGAF